MVQVMREDCYDPDGDGVISGGGNVLKASGTFVGTGEDQIIALPWEPVKLTIGPLEEGIVFTGRSVEVDHFHITATLGKNCYWEAEKLGG